MRVSVLLKDKNDQFAWGEAQKTHASGENMFKIHGKKGTGEVAWEFETGSPKLMRAKVKAYSVEYGYMDGGEFIVLDEDLYKTKSYQKLKEEHRNSLRLTCSLMCRQNLTN